jgi:hypothetical protein
MITTGCYAREIATGGLVFVPITEVAGCGVNARRTDGTAACFGVAELAPVTEDENIAAAMEWSIATGQFTLIADGAGLDDLVG